MAYPVTKFVRRKGDLAHVIADLDRRSVPWTWEERPDGLLGWRIIRLDMEPIEVNYPAYAYLMDTVRREYWNSHGWDSGASQARVETVPVSEEEKRAVEKWQRTFQKQQQQGGETARAQTQVD